MIIDRGTCANRYNGAVLPRPEKLIYLRGLARPM